ncbi:3-oxoacyl-ACP reductase family protein [Consotaella aegiceratis]|uniref:3-oxoacyl-ACP reductase family protein n=1 Tax=Consotaella aegiceratis TaxID=3097961 RepID=UPI002F3EA35A
MPLKDRVALVTGASRGIGAAIASKLAGQGAAVGVNYFTSREKAERLVQTIEEGGGKAIAVQGDTRVRDQAEAMVRDVERTLGPVDILVVNAAMSFPTTPFTEMGWTDFEAKLVGELASAFHVCQTVVPGMMQRRRGAIVAVGSTLSRTPAPGYFAHSAAKSGLDGFVKSLALELGPHGIRVNTVAPGLTETEATAHIPAEVKAAMTRHLPLGRTGKSEDVANVVAFMVSDEAAHLTGCYTPVGGGNLFL